MTILTADEIFEQAHGDLFVALGATATYTPTVGAPFSVRIIEIREQEIPVDGFEGQVTERRTTLDMPKATLTAAGITPVRGDQITVGATTWTVDRSRLSDDGYAVTVAVK